MVSNSDAPGLRWFSLTLKVERDTAANIGMIDFASDVGGMERRSVPIGNEEYGLFCVLDVGPEGQLLSLELLNFEVQTAAMDLHEVTDGN